MCSCHPKKGTMNLVLFSPPRAHCKIPAHLGLQRGWPFDATLLQKWQTHCFERTLPTCLLGHGHRGCVLPTPGVFRRVTWNRPPSWLINTEFVSLPPRLLGASLVGEWTSGVRTLLWLTGQGGIFSCKQIGHLAGFCLPHSNHHNFGRYGIGLNP